MGGCGRPKVLATPRQGEVGAPGETLGATRSHTRDPALPAGGLLSMAQGRPICASLRVLCWPLDGLTVGPKPLPQ